MGLTSNDEPLNAEPAAAKLTRRDLLLRVAALQAAASLPVLQACSRGEPLPDGAPFSLWRRMRDALRSSPDHLAARAVTVASTRDIQAIFAFVRDEIALRPWTSPSSAAQPEQLGYAGVRGVLRSGVATAREKSELLQSLLRDAGFDAGIVDGDVDFASLGGTRLYAAGPAARFAPDDGIAPVSEWLDELGIEAMPETRKTSLDAALVDTIAERLLAAVPDDARGAPEDWARLNGWLPLVRVTTDDEPLYLNPNVPDAVPGEHYCIRAPRPSRLQGPAPTPTLRVAAAITRRSEPQSLETIIDGEWPIGDLVGRRLQLRFLPTQSLDDMLPMTLQQLRSFQPAFVVAGSDVTESDADRLSVSGDVITLEGERISTDGADILVDGHPLALGDADPALAASVADVDLVVNASEYPRLRVEAGLRAANGSAITGLPLSVFGLQHAGRPVAVRLLRNLPESPRIAFALDFSTSLPEEHRGVRLAELVERMSRAVAERQPAARFRVGAFSGGPVGNAVSWFGDWSGDIADTVASVHRAGPTAPQTSSYFAALADATNGDASVVVLVTDADGSAATHAKFDAMISSGCPAVILSTQSALTRADHFERMAALSGGHLFPIENTAQAVDRVAELAVASEDRPYVFEFVADDADDATVSLAVPAADAAGTATYERPAAPMSPVRAISGLFLTVELGNRRVTRRLAGFPLVNPALEAVTDEHLLAARLALLGRYDLSVEASAPTAAAALDDILAANLTCETLVAAAATRDEDTILDATRAGFDQLPERWLALNTPLPGGMTPERRSFQAGYRMMLFSDLPVPAGHYRRKVDILPFTDWRTITTGDAFAANLKHTLQMTMLEAGNFPVSTLTAAGDSGYVHKRGYLLSNWVTTIADEAAKHAWQLAVADRVRPKLPHDVLVPDDPAKCVYWEIDSATGAMLGLLPDASGGATAEDTARRFELLNQVIDAYAKVMQALMATPPVFKVWVALEKAKLEHLKRATIALILMDGTHTSGYGELLASQIEDYISGRVRGALDSVLGGVLTGYSDIREAAGWYHSAESLWGSATGPAR